MSEGNTRSLTGFGTAIPEHANRIRAGLTALFGRRTAAAKEVL
jgi:hypothetical protein